MPTSARQRKVFAEEDGADTWWRTPPWVTALLLDVHPPPHTELVIEPSAGEGDIVRVLKDDGYEVWAIERRRSCRSALETTACWVSIRDWLEVEPRNHSPLNEMALFGIVGNPPYSPASVAVWHGSNADHADAGADSGAARVPRAPESHPA